MIRRKNNLKPALIVKASVFKKKLMIKLRFMVPSTIFSKIIR